MTGRDFQGRVIGNRALIYFGEIALTRKLTKSHSIVRAAYLSDAKPVNKSIVTALDKDLKEIARSPTDENGLATFDAAVHCGWRNIFSAKGLCNRSRFRINFLEDRSAHVRRLRSAHTR